MKRAFLLLGLIFFLPAILAINLDVKKISNNEVLIEDLGKPAVFELEIRNLGEDDSFEFYNFLGFKMFPVGTVPIKSGETKEVKLEIIPLSDFNYRGQYILSYFIKGSGADSIKKDVTFKIIDLKDAFEIGSNELDPESNSITIYIKNNENFEFPDIDVKFDSIFFDTEEEFDLEPYEKKEFEIELDKKDFRELLAGYYTLKADVEVYGKNAEVEGVINFKEKDNLKTTINDYGFIINNHIITKENEGNVVANSTIAINRNIISRIFTTFNIEPDVVEREGFNVYYTWKEDIRPGETFELKVKTNWLIPFLIIIFIVIAVVLAKKYVSTDIVLRKRVSFVKAKGGEFALKVSITVSAKNFVERVNIHDRLPPLVKVYERFGGEKPQRINHSNKKIEWYFEKLEAGEVRVLSYIIYSKVGVLGKFALPSATAIYEKEGKIKEEESNKAFFISESIGKQEEN